VVEDVVDLITERRNLCHDHRAGDEQSDQRNPEHQRLDDRPGQARTAPGMRTAEMKSARQECTDRPDRRQSSGEQIEAIISRSQIQRETQHHCSDHDGGYRNDAATSKRRIALPMVAGNGIEQSRPQEPAEFVEERRPTYRSTFIPDESSGDVVEPKPGS
jgi:hypothetical protein